MQRSFRGVQPDHGRGHVGPYDSVIGMNKEQAIHRFLKQTPHKYETATNDVHLCAVVVEVEVERAEPCDRTGDFPKILKPSEK